MFLPMANVCHTTDFDIRNLVGRWLEIDYCKSHFVVMRLLKISATHKHHSLHSQSCNTLVLRHFRLAWLSKYSFVSGFVLNS